tara:strand:- start:284 stop:604 length:321 start_codon:yes stop_codon:yes gene_type:complete
MSALTSPTYYALFATFLSFLIPFGIWYALRSWKPESRKRYAAKFALWPLIIFSYSLGSPLARAILGITHRYRLDLGESIPAIILLGALGAPFAFGIGYFIARKKFK